MRRQTTGSGFQARWRVVAWVALVSFTLNPLLVVAQSNIGTPMVLKSGDRLQLSVPGRPELEQDLVLDAAGNVDIEPVGGVHLGGLSADEASQLLKQKLRLFYPTLDALHVEVGRTGAVRIYVLGAVNTRGMINFESVPSLWDVLRAIGGPVESANLSEARVIREVDGQPQVLPVDLSGFLNGEGISAFTMQDGDTLIIPALLEGIPGVSSHAGVKVFGSVAVPTIVPIAVGTPLMDVLMLAGAPTQDANKAKIYWVHNDGAHNQAQIVDLEQYLLLGDDAGNPLVYPGDTVSVEYERPSWVRSNVPFILGSLAAMATIYLAYDNVVNDSD